MSAEKDILGRLFRCDRYVSLFPTGMPVRACLRRQLDRQVALDGTGKPRPLADWPPSKPFCANECSLGRQHLEEARAAAVPAETCLRCGSAQVGSGSAAPCAGCEPDAKEVPRGHLAPAQGPGLSSRIWRGEVPDVPIAGLGERKPVAPLLPRQHHASTPAPPAPVNQEEPAEPAEDTTMPRGKPSERRNCCESKGTRHLASCPTQRKAPGGVQAGRVKAPKARTEKVAGGLRDDEAVMPARIAVRVRALTGNGPTIHVATLGVEKLLELVAEAKKELARRRDEARSLASKLETALEELGQ